ncbi:DUF222 domain-containing protein [Herbiconiux sp. P18]|uniref:HNH endonuclease signature motif containing protein n=1 Tax=Herbiconiux liangxiaofengii TaxID=3342795 RepID=UPI0035BA6266
MAERTRAARDERHVALEPGCDGLSTLVHLLPAAEALAIDDLIDRMARSQRSDTDPRSHAQRRSDVLTGLVLGTCDRGAFTPTVLLTVPAATIAGHADEPGDLHGYGPIDPDTARGLAARAPTHIRVLTHPTTGDPVLLTRHRRPPSAHPDESRGTALPTAVAGPEAGATVQANPASATGGAAPAAAESGRSRYSASALMRTALMVADETCRFPNCARRASRCELDHTRDWALGGSTTPDNLAHLCSGHHHLKHHGGWSVEAGPGRTLLWTTPRGAQFTTHPARGASP